jgi:uncharacterized protein YbjQ (UPF0145 family)
MYEARELAVARMQSAADQVGGAMVIDMGLYWSTHVWENNIIEFHATGNAIRPLDGDALPPAAPQLTLDM